MRSGRRFPPGQGVATPGALDALTGAGVAPGTLLARHISGDWGDVCRADARENELSVREGFRILSSYPLSTGAKVWIITEADRSSTCILRPEDY